GDGVREIARARTGERVEAELLCTRQRDGDHAVLERVRGVGGLVLDVELVEPEPLREAIGLDQRRPAGGRRGGGRAGERQEVRVAPHRVRPRLDLALERRRVTRGQRVADLERAEAAFADEARLERVGGLALLALQGICRHWFESSAWV